MRSLAIIGAGGFVGTRLIEVLILSGIKEFFAVVRGFHSQARFSRFGSAVTVRMADATSVKELDRALSGIEVVVNLVSGEASSISRSTEVIYQACVDNRVKRLIHMSSAVIYGVVPSETIHDDSPPLRGLWSPYSKAKARSEIFLRERLDESPLEICVLRPSLVWGPRSVWSSMAARDLMNRTAYLVGEGAGLCNTIYVDNLVSCILMCSEHPGSATGFFNVSDMETITWRDFYGSLASHFDYDMNRIPRVPGDKFRPTIRQRFDEFKMSPIYSRFKERIPLEKRAAIKAWVKARLQARRKEMGLTSDRSGLPLVTRQVWELQSTRRKLPNAKFQKHFTYQPPLSFEEGTERTIQWLTFVGLS